MPKLDKLKMAIKIRRVEDAALKLFRKKGFHGVGIREIAGEASVSLGNIYNYFESKEELFESILGRLYNDFLDKKEPLFVFMQNSRFPDDLEELGHALSEMVDRHEDLLNLIYLDIAEFSGKHIRHFYDNLAAGFDIFMKAHFEKLRAKKAMPTGVDPAVAFSVIYMQFFNFFVVERLIGAKGHMGLSDKEAIRVIAKIFKHGIGG